MSDYLLASQKGLCSMEFFSLLATETCCKVHLWASAGAEQCPNLVAGF